MNKVNDQLLMWRSYTLGTLSNIYFVVNLSNFPGESEQLFKIHFFSGKPSSFLNGYNGIISLILTPYDLSEDLSGKVMNQINLRLNSLINEKIIDTFIIKNIDSSSKRITITFKSCSDAEFALTMFSVAVHILKVLGIHQELESRDWYRNLQLHEIQYIKYNGNWYTYETYILKLLNLVSIEQQESADCVYQKEILEFI